MQENTKKPRIGFCLLAGVLAGFIILHQKLSSRELAGCALMFTAIILVQLRFNKKSNVNGD